MLRYVGGKVRLAKEITDILLKHKKPEHQYYMEPFFGGGGMVHETRRLELTRIANDSHKGLISLYKLLQMGWLPPRDISYETYQAYRYMTPHTIVEEALQAYIGFGLSFDGAWYGSYARDPKGGRNFGDESFRRLIKHIPDIEDIVFHSMDYRQLFPITDEYLIYADPPYDGTMGITSHHKYTTNKHAYGDHFDHSTFWEVMRNWTQSGATVIVSEYTAPADFEIIWEKPYKTYGITRGQSLDKVERLFKYKGCQK